MPERDNSCCEQMGERGNILIVDDLAENLRLLSTILSKHGHDVWPAPSGKIALETMKRRLPDLVILDICMPDMDGFEVCEKMKADKRLSTIPVIFISALAATEDKIKAFLVGGVDYITKPFQVEEVLVRVNTHLTMKRLQLRTEKNLHQTEKKYKEIFNSTKEGIIIYDAQTQGIIDINQTAAEISGYPWEEITKLKLGDLSQNASPYSRKELLSFFNLANQGTPQTFEWQIRHKSGANIWVEITLKKSFIAEHAVVILVARDISERKAVEDKVLQQATLLRSVFDSVPDALVITDLQRKIVMANPGFNKTFGYEGDEILGQETSVLYESLEEFERQGKIRFNLSAEEKRQPYEVPYKRKNGDVFPGETVGTVIKTKQGESQGYLGLMRDITDRKKAEEAIIRSESLHKKAQEIAKLGHWELDIASKKLVWSDEMYHIFDIDKEQLKASYETFLAAVHPDDKDFVEKAYSESLRNKTKHDIVHRVITNDGQMKYLHEKCKTEYDTEGTPIRSIGTAQDVTRLKVAEQEKENLEKQLRQAQKLEAIGTLAGGIAHDFNNILSAILGYGEIVLSELDRNSPLGQDQQNIINAGIRAKDLVAQILTFSQQNEQEFAPMKMNNMITEVIKLLRASIPSTIEIQLEIDSGCGPIMADPTQIHQLVMNLCTNAYHAMRETGGTLNVGLKEVEMTTGDTPDASQTAKHVRLEISDTGHGMDKLTQEKIFDPYFTTKGKGEGTGLGLAVVHGVVKDHGGKITVQSNPGQGTTFHVFFPLLDEEKSNTMLNNLFDTTIPTGNERIYVVDDDLTLTALHKRNLESLGYHISAFSNSMDLLKIFKESPHDADLIITDMIMPHMTGAELSEEILKLRPDMPIILCTGFSELINESEAQSLGIRKYIMKPTIKNELACAVREVLNTRAEC